MGRITIFTADGCRHCRRIEAALEARNIPFVEISVTKYPKKRNDMVALCDRTSTPQVFFNTAHIGGADETMAALQRWDDEIKNNNKSKYKTPLQRYQVEIANNFDPGNPRFAIPQEEEASSANNKEQPSQGEPQDDVGHDSSMKCNKKQQEVVLPSGETLSVLTVTETLKNILPRNSNKRKATIYKNSFTGSEAVKAIASHFELSDDDTSAAIEFGRSLQQLQILHAVPRRGGGDHDAHVFDKTDQLLFRLQCDDQPHVLNSYRVWPRLDCKKESAPRAAADHAMRLVSRLTNMMIRIESSVTDNDGGIDYTKVACLPAFPKFEEAVCEIQTVNLATLDDKTKNAFCINLYNLMIKYAFMKLGAGRTKTSRHTFFSTVGFTVGGGHFFSFTEFENGILRGNRKAPYALRAPLSKQDPRRQLIVQQPDFRFHFGLNCGATGCPPVRNFSAEDLDNELDIVASAFCEDDTNLVIDAKKREIQVSKIVYWYKSDFLGSNSLKHLPNVLLEYLRGHKKQTLQKMLSSREPIKVSFLEYDWTPNIQSVNTFNASDLKIDAWAIARRASSSSSMLSSSSHHEQTSGSFSPGSQEFSVC